MAFCRKNPKLSSGNGALKGCACPSERDAFRNAGKLVLFLAMLDPCAGHASFRPHDSGVISVMR
jgi:hypothetical protein